MLYPATLSSVLPEASSPVTRCEPSTASGKNRPASTFSGPRSEQVSSPRGRRTAPPLTNVWAAFGLDAEVAGSSGRFIDGLLTDFLLASASSYRRSDVTSTWGACNKAAESAGSCPLSLERAFSSLTHLPESSRPFSSAAPSCRLASSSPVGQTDEGDVKKGEAQLTVVEAQSVPCGQNDTPVVASSLQLKEHSRMTGGSQSERAAAFHQQLDVTAAYSPAEDIPGPRKRGVKPTMGTRLYRHDFVGRVSCSTTTQRNNRKERTTTRDMLVPLKEQPSAPLSKGRQLADCLCRLLEVALRFGSASHVCRILSAVILPILKRVLREPAKDTQGSSEEPVDRSPQHLQSLAVEARAGAKGERDGGSSLQGNLGGKEEGTMDYAEVLECGEDTHRRTRSSLQVPEEACKRMSVLLVTCGAFLGEALAQTTNGWTTYASPRTAAPVWSGGSQCGVHEDEGRQDEERGCDSLPGLGRGGGGGEWDQLVCTAGASPVVALGSERKNEDTEGAFEVPPVQPKRSRVESEGLTRQGEQAMLKRSPFEWWRGRRVGMLMVEEVVACLLDLDQCLDMLRRSETKENDAEGSRRVPSGGFLVSDRHRTEQVLSIVSAAAVHPRIAGFFLARKKAEGASAFRGGYRLSEGKTSAEYKRRQNGLPFASPNDASPRDTSEKTGHAAGSCSEGLFSREEELQTILPPQRRADDAFLVTIEEDKGVAVIKTVDGEDSSVCLQGRSAVVDEEEVETPQAARTGRGGKDDSAERTTTQQREEEICGGDKSKRSSPASTDDASVAAPAASTTGSSPAEVEGDDMSYSQEGVGDNERICQSKGQAVAVHMFSEEMPETTSSVSTIHHPDTQSPSAGVVREGPGSEATDGADGWGWRQQGYLGTSGEDRLPSECSVRTPPHSPRTAPGDVLSVSGRHPAQSQDTRGRPFFSQVACGNGAFICEMGKRRKRRDWKSRDGHRDCTQPGSTEETGTLDVFSLQQVPPPSACRHAVTSVIFGALILLWERGMEGHSRWDGKPGEWREEGGQDVGEGTHAKASGGEKPGPENVAVGDDDGAFSVASSLCGRSKTKERKSCHGSASESTSVLQTRTTGAVSSVSPDSGRPHNGCRGGFVPLLGASVSARRQVDWKLLRTGASQVSMMGHPCLASRILLSPALLAAVGLHIELISRALGILESVGNHSTEQGSVDLPSLFAAPSSPGVPEGDGKGDNFGHAASPVAGVNGISETREGEGQTTSISSTFPGSRSRYREAQLTEVRLGGGEGIEEEEAAVSGRTFFLSTDAETSAGSLTIDDVRWCSRYSMLDVVKRIMRASSHSKNVSEDVPCDFSGSRTFAALAQGEVEGGEQVVSWPGKLWQQVSALTLCAKGREQQHLVVTPLFSRDRGTLREEALARGGGQAFSCDCPSSTSPFLRGRGKFLRTGGEEARESQRGTREYFSAFSGRGDSVSSTGCDGTGASTLVSDSLTSSSLFVSSSPFASEGSYRSSGGGFGTERQSEFPSLSRGEAVQHESRRCCLHSRDERLAGHRRPSPTGFPFCSSPRSPCDSSVRSLSSKKGQQTVLSTSSAGSSLGGSAAAALAALEETMQKKWNRSLAGRSEEETVSGDLKISKEDGPKKDQERRVTTNDSATAERSGAAFPTSLHVQAPPVLGRTTGKVVLKREDRQEAEGLATAAASREQDLEEEREREKEKERTRERPGFAATKDSLDHPGQLSRSLVEERTSSSLTSPQGIDLKGPRKSVLLEASLVPLSRGPLEPQQRELLKATGGGALGTGKEGNVSKSVPSGRRREFVLERLSFGESVHQAFSSSSTGGRDKDGEKRTMPSRKQTSPLPGLSSLRASAATKAQLEKADEEKEVNVAPRDGPRTGEGSRLNGISSESTEAAKLLGGVGGVGRALHASASSSRSCTRLFSDSSDDNPSHEATAAEGRGKSSLIDLSKARSGKDVEKGLNPDRVSCTSVPCFSTALRQAGGGAVGTPAAAESLAVGKDWEGLPSGEDPQERKSFVLFGENVCGGTEGRGGYRSLINSDRRAMKVGVHPLGGLQDLSGECVEEKQGHVEKVMTRARETAVIRADEKQEMKERRTRGLREEVHAGEGGGKNREGSCKTSPQQHFIPSAFVGSKQEGESASLETLNTTSRKKYLWDDGFEISTLRMHKKSAGRRVSPPKKQLTRDPLCAQAISGRTPLFHPLGLSNDVSDEDTSDGTSSLVSPSMSGLAGEPFEERHRDRAGGGCVWRGGGGAAGRGEGAQSACPPTATPLEQWNERTRTTVSPMVSLDSGQE